MARDYWVETFPDGRQRLVSSLKRSHSHSYDAQPKASRHVDFLDVTRDEYTGMLQRQQSLREEKEALERENYALKSNWRACDEELRRIQHSVRNLEYENRELRRSVDGLSSREAEDSIRRLRHRNTKLQNENDGLLARVRTLEREVRDSVGHRVRQLMDEVAGWRRRYDKLDGAAERLQQKLEAAEDRNHRLSVDNESRAREERRLRRSIDTYEAIMRRHGLLVR